MVGTQWDTVVCCLFIDLGMSGLVGLMNINEQISGVILQHNRRLSGSTNKIHDTKHIMTVTSLIIFNVIEKNTMSCSKVYYQMAFVIF